MEEIDLKELLGIVKEKIVQIILIIILAAVMGGVYTYYFTIPKYTSVTKLVLTGADETSGNSNSITTTDVTLNSKLVSTYSELVKSNNIIRQVISNLGIEEEISETALKKSVTVSAVDDTEVIEISVTNEDTELAAEIANEIANVFSEKVGEIYNINNVYIVDQAEETSSPSNIHHSKDICIATFGGVIVAAAYVFLSNMFDTSIKSAEVIEKSIGIPVLVSIPQISNFDKEKGGKKKK